LLGLFGADDQHPSPEQVNELEQALIAQGKTYEFTCTKVRGMLFSPPIAELPTRRGS